MGFLISTNSLHCLAVPGDVPTLIQLEGHRWNVLPFGCTAHACTCQGLFSLQLRLTELVAGNSEEDGAQVMSGTLTQVLAPSLNLMVKFNLKKCFVRVWL